eukprot:CAMPEP_0198201920 /NCGR_PEP_ID=MMETSP1445-20131203/4948_1 /TAXON_ID=36898 /ORGANISM="Pyramimonas sp., Strain CCMP2087" /LENGTH=190 /DNA_ID=CAMNT_0043872575 /DNA_START=252 /DNA_END=821 /DNA_ORIENTATION=-
MKTKTGRREINPTDSFRKEQRKRELKKNQKERKKVRTGVLLHKDLDTIHEKILELGDCEDDKTKKAKKKTLEDQYKKALEMHKENPASASDARIQSHIEGNVETRVREHPTVVNQPTPEDSVYYHPTLNPYGQPPPGQAQKWKVGFNDPLASANLQRVDPAASFLALPAPQLPYGMPANLPIPAPPPRPP